MMNFFDNVSKGEALSGFEARLYMYGIYLANGGTPKDYEEMDEDDIAVMYLSWMGTESRRHNRLFGGLIEIILKIFGK